MGKPRTKKEPPAWKKAGVLFDECVEVQIGGKIVKLRANFYGRAGRSLLITRVVWERFKKAIKRGNFD